MTMRQLSAVAAWVTAALPALLLFRPLRDLLEAQMALHMLIELPVLLLAGWTLAARIRCVGVAHWTWSSWNGQGLTSLSAASCILAFWMIPAAIDLSLLDAWFRLSKYVSIYVAGALFASGKARASPEVLMFFGGNLAWMMATFGLYVMDSPIALCVSYLVGDQSVTGAGLVLVSIALAAALVRTLTQSKTAATNPIRRPSRGCSA